MNTRGELINAASKMKVSMTDAQADTLLQYLDLLLKWNQAFNLTAITDPKEMLVKHLLDSLSIVPYLQGETLLDVGTGPGLPGLVSAVLFPEKHWTLLDSSEKKIRFLIQAKAVLNLPQIEPVASRVESYQKAGGFDMILSRAFSSLDTMINATRHCCHAKTIMLAMKGQYPENELAAIDPELYQITVHELSIPGLAAKRHAVLITPRHHQP